MAPKSSARSQQPSKEKEEMKQPADWDDDESETESEEEDEEKAKGKDEEEDGSSTSSEDEDDEDLEKEKQLKTPNPPPKSSSKLAKQQEDDGSDSESESDASPSNYKLQPITKPSTSTAKRSIQEINGQNPSKSSSKKPKVEGKKAVSAVPSTPSAFTRLWSNEDEVAVLNGMAEFRSLKGKSPNSDMEGFHNFIKAKLKVDFSKDQLRTKIRRMNKRYLNAVKKGGNGSDPVFSNPHEDMLFKLSKKIWGGDVQNNKGSKGGAKSGVQENAKKEIQKVEKINENQKLVVIEEEKGVEKVNFWSKYPFLTKSFQNMVGSYPSLALSEGAAGFIRENLRLIGDVKAKELDDKWEKLVAEEAELNYKMLTLMTEQVKLALHK